MAARWGRWPIALLAMPALVASCAKPHERRLCAVSCGPGTLSLEVREIKKPPGPSQARFTLFYEEGGRKRVLDVLKPLAQIYADLTEEERYTRLRSGPDEWPIFVNPAAFTPAEFDQIRACLREHLAEIDAASSKEKTHLLGFDAEPRLSSIRYVDYQKFGRDYRGLRSDLTVKLHPGGDLWFLYPGGASRVGDVIDHGKKMVLMWGLTNVSKARLTDTDPIAYILACKDGRGRTIADDFEVIRASNEAHDAALRQEQAARARALESIAPPAG